MLTTQQVAEVYQRFNSGDFDEPVAAYTNDAVLRQLNTSLIAVGPDQIRTFLMSWSNYFKNPRITNVAVVAVDDQVSEMKGAAQCFKVTFIGRGRYINTPPGSDIPPATNAEVELPFTEFAWFNAGGQCIGVENLFDTRALQTSVA